MPHTERSDHELMLAFQAGEVEAFTELYERHLKGLLNFFFRLSWDLQLSEDFAQEVLVRIFRASRDWTPQAKFTTYLYRVAKNLWIDRVRSAHVRRAGGSLDEVASSQGHSTERYIDLLPSDLQPPEGELERREQYAAIMRAIETLPQEQRMVFVLSEIEGMRYSEISQIMDIPIGTVKSRMHSAVARLRAALESMEMVQDNEDDHER